VVRYPAAEELEGEVIPLLTANTLGRAPDNSVVLPDPSASGYHARIDFDQDRFILADMGSTNGTFLNDSVVMKPTVLRAGDRIQIGSAVFVFRAG
jgi:pSer/pThr/pTyr-binding forkhead associated (FHA) protein